MISIIIPCYNAANFIAETLESIINQREVDFEIIVVDDGSTDNSATIIKAIDNPYLTYLSKSNRGVAAARNYGLSYARGEYVIFFDADDKMSLGFLANRLAALESKDIGFSCGSVITFPTFSKKTFGITNNAAEKLLTYQPEYSSCPSNYLIRTSVLVDNGIKFNEALSSTADRYFLLELANKTKGILITESPLLYRISPESMSNKMTPKLILDNERYFRELKANNLIPYAIEEEFLFKIQYILGAGFLRTGLYKKGIKYILSSFLKSPIKFLIASIVK